MAGGLEQLGKLIQLRNLANAGAQQQAALQYRQLQDQRQAEQWKKSYDLQKRVQTRLENKDSLDQLVKQQVSNKLKGQREFNSDNSVYAPRIIDSAGANNKVEALRDYGEFLSGNKYATKDALKNFSDLYDKTYNPSGSAGSFKGIQFGSLSPEIGYVASRFVDKYHKAPQSRADLEEAIRLGYTDEVDNNGNIIPWEKVRENFSSARTAGRVSAASKTADGKYYQGFNQKTGEPFLIPIPEGGNIPIKDEPLPATSQDTLSQGLRGVSMLNNMDKIVGDVTSDVPVWSRVKGWMSKGKLYAGAGTSEEEQYKTYTDGLMMLAQSFIKGTPSDFDVNTFRETIPQFGTNTSLAKKKIKQAKDMLSNEVRRQLSFYKGTNKPVPFSIIEAAGKLGIPVDNIEGSDNPWASSSDNTGYTEDQELEAFRALGADATDKELDDWLSKKYGGK